MADRKIGRHGPPVKTTRIIFAVTPAEKTAMKKAAAARGVTITDYLLSLHRREAGPRHAAEAKWWAHAGELNRLAEDVKSGRVSLQWTQREIDDLKKQLGEVRVFTKALAEHLANGGEDSVKERRRIAAEVLGEKKGGERR